ncbi:ABC transporter substrate-binding protein [Paenibacillus abyssi]|uniref:ABC transporter substrate-binding protein n=1 Tax=Paenibacillus abyssi TaxID=1340531 RepID=A0A917CXE9_9BACL|nr:ABC transporter substrate-binding protein [Paenibacillus abyssi]
MRGYARLLAVILACVLIIAGCSSNNNGNNAGNAQPSGNAANAPGDTDGKGTGGETGERDLSPITFTMFSADLNPNYENMQSPVGQEITKRTGVTLNIEYPVGDIKQKISLMAASGDYPDLIFAKGDQNILVDAGAFIDLTDLIEEHGPNLKKLYGPYLKRLRYSKDDPSIYFVGSFGVDAQQWQPNNGFQLQHAAVKEAGYPSIKTLQDYEKVIKDYIEKNPTIDGQPAIGLSLIADDWRYLISVTNPAVFATGGPDDGEWYVDPQTHKAALHHTRPEEKEYFRWLNHMNDIGLLDKESFIQKYDQYQAKISSGRVVGLIDAKWQYEQAELALRQEGKLDRMYGMYPVTMNENVKYADFQSAGYSAGWGIGISSTAKDPVRAIQFLDWLASEEAQILNNWGIEGVHYTIHDGKRVISDEEMNKRTTDPEYGKKTGIGVYTYPFPQYGDGVLDSTGQTYTINSKEQIAKNYTDVEKEVLSKYGAQMWMDLYPAADEFPVKPWGAAWQINIPQETDAAVQMQRISDIIKKRIPEAILAKPDQFDAVWDSFMSDIQREGLDQLTEEFNGLLQERLELWND